MIAYAFSASCSQQEKQITHSGTILLGVYAAGLVRLAYVEVIMMQNAVRTWSSEIDDTG